MCGDINSKIRKYKLCYITSNVSFSSGIDERKNHVSVLACSTHQAIFALACMFFSFESGETACSLKRH